MSLVWVIIAGIGLSGCIRPYKVDVEQGNLLELQRLADLHVGMTRTEVDQLLGKSILKTPFTDKNHVSYVYTQQVNGGKMLLRRVQLTFRDDKLVRIE